MWDYWIKKIVKKLNCLSRFVVLTQEDRVLWTELDNVEIIPNPIAFVPSVFSTCTNHHVIAVGRYVPQKGFDMLLLLGHKLWQCALIGSCIFGERVN